jgi:hypothetical protein
MNHFALTQGEMKLPPEPKHKFDFESPDLRFTILAGQVWGREEPNLIQQWMDKALPKYNHPLKGQGFHL